MKQAPDRAPVSFDLLLYFLDALSLREPASALLETPYQPQSVNFQDLIFHGVIFSSRHCSRRSDL